MNTILSFDFYILNQIQNIFKNEILDFLMPKISFLGNKAFIFILIGIILLFFKETKKVGISILISLVISLITVNLILKPLIARQRPFIINPYIELIIKTPMDFSFPSGHATVAFQFATIICFWNKKIGFYALQFAILMAFSRLYLYVHFPSDIIAGIFLGILIGIISNYLTNKYLKF